ELPSIRSSGEPIGSVAFSSDGKFVLAGLWHGQLTIWDFATRKVVATHKEHTGWVTTVAGGGKGKSFGKTSSERTVNLWDAATFKHLARLRGHVGEVWTVAISPDGRTVMSGSDDGTTKLWSADTRHVETVLDGFGGVLGFTDGGRSLIAVKTDLR